MTLPSSQTIFHFPGSQLIESQRETWSRYRKVPFFPQKRLGNRNYDFKLNTLKQPKLRQYRKIADCTFRGQSFHSTWCDCPRKIADCTFRGQSHHVLWNVMNRSRILLWLLEYSPSTKSRCGSFNSSLDAKHGLSLFDLYSAP